MNTKFDLEAIAQDIVYVKQILATDLPEDMRDKVGNLIEWHPLMLHAPIHATE